MKTSTIILLLALTVLTLVPSQAEGKARRCKGKVQGQYTHAHQCKDSGKYQVLHSLFRPNGIKSIIKICFYSGGRCCAKNKNGYGITWNRGEDAQSGLCFYCFTKSAGK